VWLVSCTVQIVEPGTVGVVTHFGAVQDEVLPEGLHFVVPVQTRVISLSTRVQKMEDEASASSKDLQVVTSRIALNFYLEKAKANVIFQKLGLDYKTNVIHPAIQESVKASTAHYTAEELITRRAEVKNAIFDDVKKRLGRYDIVVTDFSIIDFAFSPEFNKAIEEKQVAEQSALRAKNDLVRIRTEAEQVKVKAEGEAEARIARARAEAEGQRLQRETLTPELVQLRAIEKWNGEMPQMMAGGDGATPFLNFGAKAK
jgi:regulator of protease activity HflC (stomatin/prohibitin superfamily)